MSDKKLLIFPVISAFLSIILLISLVASWLFIPDAYLESDVIFYGW